MMVDWRKLGEVPDSEDEDYESQDDIDPLSLPDATSETTPKANRQQTKKPQHHTRQEEVEDVQLAEKKDVWDIPSSSDNDTTPKGKPAQIHDVEKSPKLPPRLEKQESPLSSLSTLSTPLSSSQGLPTLDQLTAIPNAASEPPSSPTPVPQDDISNNIVRVTSPTPVFQGPDDALDPSQLSPMRIQTNTSLPGQGISNDDEAQEARRAAIRYERSLRSRKPEQLRPYFMEQARYNHSWKEHGLRPVRLVNQETRVRQEESSSEGEFEPESQGSKNQENTEESQVNDSLGDSFVVTEGLQVGLLSSSPLETSPVHRRLGPSSQATSKGESDNTSVNGEDLPSLDALLARREPPTRQPTKRSSMLTQSAAKKRRIVNQTTQGPPSPKFRQLSPTPGPNLSSPPRRWSSKETTLQPSQDSPAPVVVLADSDHDQPPSRNILGDDEETASASSSDSDVASEIVHRNSRRIRGVLPASWLRIDQQASLSNIQKNMNKRQETHDAEGEQRRGVAQRRLARSTSTRDLVFDDSDEEDTRTHQPTTDEVFHHQTRLILEPSATAPVHGIMEISEDDDASVFEEDHIDRMLPGRKRQLKLSDAFAREPKRQKKAPSTQVRPRQNPRQPKISDTFTKAKGATSRPKPHSKHPGNSRIGKTSKKSGARRLPMASKKAPPPQLSILDTIEPNAPRFLKIAARTAQRRADQGRASPSQKCIHLATRVDNIDVMTALRDWRSGSIQPRASVTAAVRPKAVQQTSQPLRERLANKVSRPRQTWVAPSQGARKFSTAINRGGTAAHHGDSEKQSVFQPARTARPKPAVKDQSSKQGWRQAVLEADTHNGVSNRDFQAKKRQLDRLFRQKYRNASLADVSSVMGNVEPQENAVQPDGDIVMSQEAGPARLGKQKTPQKSKFRKKTRPRRIDNEAPQYSHANDPLPIAPLVRQDPSPAEVEGSGDAKLLGLGPYGTHYTHHFEIFPLNAGTYFHSSTLIGSGVLERVETQDLRSKIKEDRQNISFHMGEKILRWGKWNAQVSSELGIVCDFVTDSLEQSQGGSNDNNQPQAIQAAHFLFNYVDQSLSFDDIVNIKFFISRWQEVLASFQSKISTLLSEPRAMDHCSATVKLVYNYLLLGTLEVLKLCRGDDSLMSEQFLLEDLLKNMTKQVAQLLIKAGLGKLRDAYRRLNATRTREQGLRDDEDIIHSWVILLKVLELAEIPRSSFWDIFQEVIAPPKVELKADAQQHEALWEDMFTLLPLTEFGNAGVVIPGKRTASSTNGWSLPKRLLSKVLESYRGNHRQSPSFNSYCRAMVSRCHYLVQRWGWYKNSAIIGTIFDFFGSQNLEHLRNEEVYQSPAFLDNLANRPSLNVDAVDRCFHVFLKLLAMTIQKLKAIGASKDIVNLIKRTTPNHNRQYLKEHNIHERDLAALRNHHDLLCTQYWVVPAELRQHVDWPERLVEPESAHKEACLINLRAWRQLSAFIVASGEANTSLKPFNQWRNTFFRKMASQFDCVATDIESQLKGLSTDVSKTISPDMKKMMISMNLAAIGDIIYHTMIESSEVIMLSPDLEAASFALNTYQLNQVFRHFSQAKPDFPWGVLREALATLSHFLSHIDKFKESEPNEESESQILNGAQADDALLVLEHNVASSFFSMARCVLSSLDRTDATTSTHQVEYIDDIINIAARLGMRLIQAGVATLSGIFKPGKFKLFDKDPVHLSLVQRKYLALFVLNLLKTGFDDFTDPGLGLMELWVQALVKPQPSLMFETGWLQELVKRGEEYVPTTTAGMPVHPTYQSNCRLFEFAISWMRKSLRDADPPLKRTLLPTYTKVLKSAMQQMKQDLSIMTKNAAEHGRYVCFVRDIIFMIRAQGADIATVNPFFYESSEDFSPSARDPHLQVASLESYALRLAQDDLGAKSQFFYFLYNNFKTALNSGKLGKEIQVLRKALKNAHIRRFILGHMLPAIVETAFEQTEALEILHVYLKAIIRLLTSNVVGYKLDSDDLKSAWWSFDFFTAGVEKLTCNDMRNTESIQLCTSFAALLCHIYPSVVTETPEENEGAAAFQTRMLSFYDWITTFETKYSESRNLPFDAVTANNPVFAFKGDAYFIKEDSRVNNDIKGFKKHIAQDIRQNWVLNGLRLSIQTPGQQLLSTQAPQGIIMRPVRSEEDDKATLESGRSWFKRLFDIFNGRVPEQLVLPRENLVF